MPSYVVRDTITQPTANKLIGKIIRLSKLYCSESMLDIGPICNIYPIKEGNKRYAMIFYLDNGEMKWALYNYRQIEIPKSYDINIYNLIINTIVNSGTVPVKIILEK